MQTGLQSADYFVFLLYFLIITSYGIWIYRSKNQAAQSSKDFFLAEGSLTWWAIGASLIASNISAEQFIGMSASGFALGLAISSYEWMAALTLVIVAIFFLPIYLKNRISTMPQFLARRYNEGVSLMMAIFWLFLYVFINLTSILYLGAISLEKMTGLDFNICSVMLATFAIFITLGGMKVIGYTDVIQVFFLILGGLATTYLALNLVSTKIGTGSGVWEGLSLIKSKAPDHFHMILDKGQMMVHNGSGGMEDAYKQLPGLAVILGGMWIANLSYWGCNQYITQRALGASLPTARAGLLFAAFLKLLMPVIVVLPGIAAYVIYNGNADTNIVNGIVESGIVKPDNSYPILLNLLPVGLKGLAFAALTAAIVASLAGKANSISTIFTLDIYNKYIQKNASEKQLIWTGRLTIIAAFVTSVTVCPTLKNFGKGFQYIQEFTGFISPGIFAIFALGFFWKKATSNGAYAAAITSILLSWYCYAYVPTDVMPFLNRMGWVFLACVLIAVLVSILEKNKASENALEVDTAMFQTSRNFKVSASIIVFIVVSLYVYFW